MNILESLKGLVTDELVTKAADTLGEEAGTISKGMQGALPSILGGLLNTDSKSQGVLSGLFGQAAGNDNLIGDIFSGLSGNDDTSGGMVNSLLSGIFGDKMNGIVNILTNLGGFKNEGSSKSILGIIGSLVASYFGKKMMKDGLGLSGILNMIGGEKDAIMAAAPEGVMDTIGIKEGPWETIKDVISNAAGAVTGTAEAVVDGAGKAVDTAGSTISSAASTAVGATEKVVDGASELATDAVEGAKKGMKWLWPLLLLAALVVGIIWFMKGCNNGGVEKGIENVSEGVAGGAENVADNVSNAAGAVVDATGDVADAVGGALDDAGNWIATKGETISIKLDDGIELASTKGSVVDKLHQFVSAPDAVADKNKAENWFNFEDVLFETGSSKLKSGSEEQLKNTVAVLNAFPNVKVKLGGYTDNTGPEDVNIKISNDRAKTVYNKLISLGAEASSFDTEKPYEGYGPKHPICAANDTEACKAQNRRIAIVVTEK